MELVLQNKDKTPMEFNKNVEEKVVNLEEVNQATEVTSKTTPDSIQTVKNAENSIYETKQATDGHVNGMVPGTPNAYTAKTTDERPKSLDPREGTLSDVNLNNLVLPYENVLFKYHQTTWNFSLYTMEQSEYKLFQADPNEPVSKYVIAQSGVTGRYSINSVQIHTAGPATPGLTTNNSLNRCVMEVVENGGMSLADELIVLSNELGYKKFMDVPLVLELNFIGQEQDSGKVTNIPGLNRKWAMRINTINATASQSGGTMNYTFQMTSTHAGIMDSRDWTLKEPYVCNSTTFGEFVASIQEQLNYMADRQYGYLASRYSEFSNGEFFTMHVPDELSSMIINYDMRQSPEADSTSSGSDGAKKFSWGANTPFSRAVDDVLDCCTPFHESTDKRRQFVNIVPVTRYVGYDPIRGTSAYKNDFYFVKYKIGDVTSVDDLEDNKFNVEYFFENADKINDLDDGQPKLNIKRYDYQFSGLNNEILDLNMKFDQAFNLAVIRNPSSQILQENTAGTHTAELLEFGGVQYSTASNADIAKLWSTASDLKKAEREGQELTDEEQQFIRDAESATLAKQQASLEGEDEQPLALSPQPTNYIEDYRDTIDLTVAGTNGIGIPRVDSIPIEPENTATNTSAAKRDNSSDQELQRKLVRDNYYNRSFMTRLDIKVMGDPYWLGWGDYSYQTYLERAVAGKDLDVLDGDRHFANYLTSEAYVLLNLKPIAQTSNDTGIIEINQSSVFAQTIYRINKVVSDFNSNGTFTQQLSGGLVIRSLRRKDQYTDNTESDNDGIQ